MAQASQVFSASEMCSAGADSVPLGDTVTLRLEDESCFTCFNYRDASQPAKANSLVRLAKADQLFARQAKTGFDHAVQKLPLFDDRLEALPPHLKLGAGFDHLATVFRNQTGGK